MERELKTPRESVKGPMMGIAMQHFIVDESGAVTVDWVVLTSAIVGLGLLALIPIAIGTTSIGNEVGGKISVIGVGY